MTSQPPDLQLCPAVTTDLPFIQAWLRQNQLPTEDITDVLHGLYLAVQNEQVVGIGGIERHGDDGLLRSLVITPALRHQGYGQQLCQKLIQKAQSDGLQALYLLTDTAADFFPKLGFEPIDRSTAPSTMQQTTEFKSLCPDSATCMRLRLNVL